MIRRISKNPSSSKSEFEIKALKITGYSFYIRSMGLLAGIIANLVTLHKPKNYILGCSYCFNIYFNYDLAGDCKKNVGKKN